MSAVAKAAMRRGWCPSTLKPMETGDGWLVRLHPPGARLAPEQLVRIAALARAHGNGLVEISARANLQLRGVTPQSHPHLVEALLAERLVDEHEGDGPQRVTLVSPLAGLEPSPFIDAYSIADAIEAAARTIPGLPPKCGVVVDDGGESSLDAFPADIRLVGVAPGLLALQLADRDWRGPVAEADAASSVIAILKGFAALRLTMPERRRLRELTAGELAGLTDLPAAAPPGPRPAPQRIGRFAAPGGRLAVAVGLPFGRCDAAMLEALAQVVETLPVTIRPSPWRGLVFADVPAATAEALLRVAEAAGLITRDDDPQLSIQACAGSPACARGRAHAAADAGLLARALPNLLRGTQLHVSGCAKGCAHPGRADLTLVGVDGRYGVVIDGRSDDEPIAVLDLPVLTARLQPGGDWRARIAGETRQTLD